MIKKKKGLLDKLKDSYQKIRRTYINDYLKPESDKYEGALIRFVPLSYLPHGEWGEVRGEYEFFKHSITIGTGPPPGQVQNTKDHEEVHSYGLQFRDELLTERVSSRSDFRAYAA